jgi:hypothetical protein
VQADGRVRLSDALAGVNGIDVRQMLFTSIVKTIQVRDRKHVTVST